MDDPLQTVRQPHGTEEVEGTQAVTGVWEVEDGACLDQEADGWREARGKERGREEIKFQVLIVTCTSTVKLLSFSFPTMQQFRSVAL